MSELLKGTCACGNRSLPQFDHLCGDCQDRASRILNIACEPLPARVEFINREQAEAAFPENLVPLHVEALSNTEQASFLRAMATQLEHDPSVAKIAIALAIQFNDGAVLCPCNGFANDTQASRYFESFMRNQGFTS